MSEPSAATPRILETLRVNGEARAVAFVPHHTLLEVLREDMGLTGTKHGCELGECGTCTVLVDGEPILSCLMLGLECDGREITTVEGLAHGDDLHPLQTAFLEHGGVQCGFCTPGMLISAVALLRKISRPTEEDIRIALSGNLCRCTGYDGIVKAVLQVADAGAVV